MKRAIALALENVRTGNGGPFAAVIVKITRSLPKARTAHLVRIDPTAHAEVVAIREACRVLAVFNLRLRSLYYLRTLPHVPRRDLLGASGGHFLRGHRGRAADAGFDDAFIYDELKIVPASGAFRMTQLLRGDSLVIFSAWKRQEKKTPTEAAQERLRSGQHPGAPQVN